MFGIKRQNGKVVITKSTIPTSTTGRQLASTLLENIKLKSQLSEMEQVQSPDVVQLPDTTAMDARIKEKVAATMAESDVRVATMIKAEKDSAPAPKVKGSNQNLPNLQAACAGQGDNITSFVRDAFTGEALYGKDAKFPTLTGGFFITNDDPSEGYYLLFNDGMTFILTAGQSQGDYMSVLYRPGSGNVSQTDMMSIVKAKLPLSKLKAYYRIVLPTTHIKPDVVMGVPWSVMNNKVDFVNATFISIPQLFRCDCPGAQIIW
jgi:hypothetical protein